jgi:sporulation protein YlmC with PRC-barrel domain
VLANPDDNIRGCEVIDRDGRELGDVDGLLVDREEQKVRFLEVGAGGFLGIGERILSIPVDAISVVEGKTVRVGRSRDELAGSPIYDPDVVQDKTDYEKLYGYYGYAPFWNSGDVYPPIMRY